VHQMLRFPTSAAFCKASVHIHDSVSSVFKRCILRLRSRNVGVQPCRQIFRCCCVLERIRRDCSTGLALINMDPGAVLAAYWAVPEHRNMCELAAINYSTFWICQSRNEATSQIVKCLVTNGSRAMRNHSASQGRSPGGFAPSLAVLPPERQLTASTSLGIGHPVPRTVRERTDCEWQRIPGARRSDRIPMSILPTNNSGHGTGLTIWAPTSEPEAEW
jgi:hypothetical protein